MTVEAWLCSSVATPFNTELDNIVHIVHIKGNFTFCDDLLQKRSSCWQGYFVFDNECFSRTWCWMDFSSLVDRSERSMIMTRRTTAHDICTQWFKYSLGLPGTTLGNVSKDARYPICMSGKQTRKFWTQIVNWLGELEQKINRDYPKWPSSDQCTKLLRVTSMWELEMSITGMSIIVSVQMRWARGFNVGGVVFIHVAEA